MLLRGKRKWEVEEGFSEGLEGEGDRCGRKKSWVFWRISVRGQTNYHAKDSVETRFERESK